MTALTLPPFLTLLCSALLFAGCSHVLAASAPAQQVIQQAPTAASVTNPFINSAAAPADFLNLTTIRTILERMEDLILFAVLSRAQYPYDHRLYDSSNSHNSSTLSSFLAQEERVLARTGQWQLPDQVPFTPRNHLPAPTQAVPTYPTVLHGSAANISRNTALYSAYLSSSLPSLQLPNISSSASLDEQPNPALGPTLNADAQLLHLLSSRIHLGRYVAESKYAANNSLYAEPIRTRNTTALNNLVTNATVEAANIQRVQTKAGTYGAQADAAGALYKDVLIPLTKEVEVGYLLGRLS